MEIKRINYDMAIRFLLPKHYSGRKPQISYAFGLYESSELMAVCTFGKPASNSLCKGICGNDFTQNVYELNRLCRKENYKNQLSEFVAYCLRELKKLNLIIVSYADRGMNHNGYIYQACNFLYTGSTKRRTDKYTKGNKHSRHYSDDEQLGLRKVRTSKHRYIYICGDKRFKKNVMKNLNYDILPYPKEQNKNYILGEYQNVELVRT